MATRPGRRDRETAEAVLVYALHMGEQEAENFLDLAPAHRWHQVLDAVCARFYGLAWDMEHGGCVEPDGVRVNTLLWEVYECARDNRYQPDSHEGRMALYVLRHSFLTQMLRYGQAYVARKAIQGVAPDEYPTWMLRTVGAWECFWLRSWGYRTVGDLVHGFLNPSGLLFDSGVLSRDQMLGIYRELRVNYGMLFNSVEDAPAALCDLAESKGEPSLSAPPWPLNLWWRVCDGVLGPVPGGSYVPLSMSVDVALSKLPARSAYCLRSWLQAGLPIRTCQDWLGISTSSTENMRKRAVELCKRPHLMRYFQYGLEKCQQEEDFLYNTESFSLFQRLPVALMDMETLGPGYRWPKLMKPEATVAHAIAEQHLLGSDAYVDHTVKRVNLQRMLRRNGVVNRCWSFSSDVPDPAVEPQPDAVNLLGAVLYDLWPLYGRDGVNGVRARSMALELWKDKPAPEDLVERIQYGLLHILNKQEREALLRVYPELAARSYEELVQMGLEWVLTSDRPLTQTVDEREALLILRGSVPLRSAWPFTNCDVWPVNMFLRCFSIQEMLTYLDRSSAGQFKDLTEDVLTEILAPRLAQIARLRWQEGVSMKECAQRLEVSHTSCQNYINGIEECMRYSYYLQRAVAAGEDGEDQLTEAFFAQPIETLGLPKKQFFRLKQNNLQAVGQVADLFRTDTGNNTSLRRQPRYVRGIGKQGYAAIYAVLEREGVVSLCASLGKPIQDPSVQPLRERAAGAKNVLVWPYNFIAFVYKRLPEERERAVLRQSRSELEQAVEFVIKAMPIQEQRIMRLRFQQYKDAEHIAKELGLDVPAVRAISYRVRDNWMKVNEMYLYLEMGVEDGKRQKREMERLMADTPVTALQIPSRPMRRVTKLGAESAYDLVRMLNGEWPGRTEGSVLRLENAYARACFEALDRKGLLNRGVYVKPPQKSTVSRKEG